MAQVRDENAIRVNFDAVPERPLVPSAANEGFEPIAAIHSTFTDCTAENDRGQSYAVVDSRSAKRCKMLRKTVHF